MAEVPAAHDRLVSSGDHAPEGSELPARTSRGPLVVAAAVVLAALLVTAGLLGGWALAGAGQGAPGDDSVDAGFARDMQIHHAQAVDMSLLVRDLTDDRVVRGYAQDILMTQQQQRGQMFAWLTGWGLPQSSSSPAMAWMGMGGMPMMGLASDSDLERLEAAEGVEAERIFLELMIAHHEGGIQMADFAADQASEPQVQRLAEAMSRGQAAEIDAMAGLLDERQA